MSSTACADSGSSQQQSSLPAWWFVVLAVLGFVLGYALVTVGANRTLGSREFKELAEFQVWRLLLAGNFGVWFAAFPIEVKWFRRARHIVDRDHSTFGKALGILMLTLVLVVIALVLGAGESLLPLDDGRIRLVVVQCVGIFAAAPAALGLLTIGLGVRAHSKHWDLPTRENVNTVLELRRYLRRFLGILGGFIGLAILATGALRNAEAAVGIEFLSESVILYGALFTALVAAYYVPAFSAVENLAMRIRDHAFRIPTIGEGHSTAAEAVDQLNDREVYGRALQLGGTARGNLESILLVFTPLLTSMITSALGSS
jgi:hypothetical protein